MAISKEEQEKRKERIKRSDRAIDKLNDPNRLKERRRDSILNTLDLDEDDDTEESSKYRKIGLPNNPIELPKTTKPRSE